jgi:amicyanin
MRTIAFACLLGVGCMIGAPAMAADAAVKIGNFTFAPQELRVKVGTKVTWTNEDDIPHTVVSPGQLRSQPLDTDQTFSFTFTKPGTYKYFCSLHPHMTGVIVIESRGADAGSQ